MAKKIRFPLDMGNGVEVRTLEELKENFSLEKVLGYCADGKLNIWLRDRYLDDIADVISGLDKEDSDFAMKICDAFDVEYSDEVDMQALEERNRKLALLKQYTDKKEYFDVVDNVAFNQDELYDLLDEDKHTIYLCGDSFSIPLSIQNMQYIGINQPVVIINAKEIIDFKSKNIGFVDVVFDEKYQALINTSSKVADKKIVCSDLIDDFNNLRGDNLVNLIEKEIKNESILADKARYMLYQIYKYVPREEKNITLNPQEEIKKAAQNGYEAARIRCSIVFNMFNQEYDGDYRKHCCQADYLEKIDMEDCFNLYEIGMAYLAIDGSKAIEFIKKSADLNCWLAEHSMGIRYNQGNNVKQNFSMANEWYKKSADKGIAQDCWQVAWNSLYNLHNEEETAYKYIILAYEDKEFIQQKYQDYKNEATLNKKYTYCYNINGISVFSAGYAPKSELRPRVEKAYNEFFSKINKAFDTNNADFNLFCNKYIDALEFCIKTKMMLDYGEKKIADICFNTNHLTYENDIRSLLSNLLNECSVSYSLYNISEEDYGWHEETGVTTSADGFFERFLTPTNYTANADDKGGKRIRNEVQLRIDRFNDKANEAMKDYFSKRLL